MNTADGHFDLNTPEALFQKANSDYLEFFENPNSWILFNLLATFSHLLEWICPEAKGKPPEPSFTQGTPEQIFYYQTWNHSDYKKFELYVTNPSIFSTGLLSQMPLSYMVHGPD